MNDVFISYKAEEVEEAGWVKSVLEGNGISCWMAPASIPGGSNYAVEIPQAIKQAKVFVLILSSKAQASRWISREIDLAINEGKIILPFMLENCALKDDFNFYLTNVQRYTAYENKAAAIEKMIKEIKALVGGDCGSVTYDIAKEKNGQNISPQKTKCDTVCILSMVFGIVAVVALLGVFLLPNIAAIVLSIIGMSNVAKKSCPGKGFAITGLTLGLVSTATGLSIPFGIVGFVISLVIAGVSLFLFVWQCKSRACSH